MSAPTIYKLSIDRFRSLQTFSWRPAKGVNVILGGGDVGKTTVLDAIALLLNPTNASTLSDTDYHSRNIDDGFAIEAILSLQHDASISQQLKLSWPWAWDGQDACIPDINAEDGARWEPVYRLRVRGTSDLELIHEVVQPNDEVDSLSPSLRRRIGLVRLGGEDRNDRDLRLVQGSALDRLLSDRALRSRLAADLAKSDVRELLADEKKEVLSALNLEFALKNLPHDLNLSITGGQGLSIAALIGLTAKRDNVDLPLASWGSGTRRFAALAIAEQNQGEAPITLVDEVERGLEPYRQRSLMESLQNGSSQVFVTTHSPSVISAAHSATVWCLDRAGAIGMLNSAATVAHRKSDPEAFLARLTIVAEGVTEMGFVTAMLERALDSPLETHGIHITDGGGDDHTLSLLEAMADAHISFGGFADDDKKRPGRWAALAIKLKSLLFRWDAGCIEDNIIGLVPEDKLLPLLIDPQNDKTGERLRTLADRLGLQGDDKDFATIKNKAGTTLTSLIISAASGTVPDGGESERKIYKSHAKCWFKTLDGGRELFEKALALDIWPALKSNLLPFCNGVRIAVSLKEIKDIVR